MAKNIFSNRMIQTRIHNIKIYLYCIKVTESLTLCLCMVTYNPILALNGLLYKAADRIS